MRPLLLAALSLVCSCASPATTVVKDVGTDLSAAGCVLSTWATDIQNGKTESQAIADAASNCSASIDQATTLLAAHRRAELAEGLVSRPDASK